MASPVASLAFLLCLFTVRAHLTPADDSLRLFEANPPVFVNVSDVRWSVQNMIDAIVDRLRCVQHGLLHTECVKCLNASTVLRGVGLNPSAGAISRQSAEDLSLLFLHHILNFEALCTSDPPGCSHFNSCAEEVYSYLQPIDNVLWPLESILRSVKAVMDTKTDKCFSAEQILEEASLQGSVGDMEKMRLIVTILMGHVFQGHCIDVGEAETDFLDDIFHKYGDHCSPVITLDGLKRMVHDLQNKGHNHDHNSEDSHDHDHKDHPHEHGCHFHDRYHDNHVHHDHDEGTEDSDEVANHTSGNFDHEIMHHKNHDHSHSHNQDIDENAHYNNKTRHLHVYRILASQSGDNDSNSELEEPKKNDDAKRTRRSAMFPHTRSEADGNADIKVNPVAATSLKSELFHEQHHKSLDALLDDVQRVYLLENDEDGHLVKKFPHEHLSLAAKCWTIEDLLLKFGYMENSSLTKYDFLELCPAIVQQIVSGVCKTRKPVSRTPTQWELYGYSSLSVLLITLTSLAGVLLLPIMTKHAYHYVMAGFYGLAFGTLAGDAFLHLLPQILGVHSHGSDDNESHNHEESHFLEPYMRLQLVVLFTIYILYLFEAITNGYSKNKHQEGKGHGHSHMHFPEDISTITGSKSKTKSQTQLTLSTDRSSSSLDTEIVEETVNKKPPNLMVSQPIIFGLTSVAFVVTLGDTIHNFSDGLAIGAAFSSGLRGGLSTSIAVFCHELPHEFGDFVILLSTGLSFSKALLINFISGLTCFGGLYFGIWIGDSVIAQKYIMAIIAGIFIYVALSEMLPELKEHRDGSPTLTLIVKSLGILAGISIMVVISIYENEINV